MNQTLSTDNKPSDLQLKVYDAVRKTRKNVAILATAGSGKTTTILACLKFVPRNESTTFLSFSKAIVDELRDRIPSYVQAKTLHGLGYGFINTYLKRKLPVEPNKYFNLALKKFKAVRTKAGLSTMLDKKEYRACFLIQDICAYARMTLVDIKKKESLMEMCSYYNIEFDDISIKAAMELLKKYALNTDVTDIDFVDMTYWPSQMPEMVTSKFMNVFLDEAQDTNKCQLALVENILHADGRLISVGDDFQCIYGFSGADVEAFKRIRERPDTIVLPLSVTYRCPKNIVKKAQTINPDIQAYEHAIEGTERRGNWDEIQEGDMVLSRTTRPLVLLYFKLIEANVKAHVVGKDIEKGLLSFIESVISESWEGLNYNIQLKRTEKENELRELGVRFPHEHPTYINQEEKIQVLNIIKKRVEGPKGLAPKVREIFHEDKKAARLMTIHRSKGLENPRVFVIDEVDGKKLMPSPWAMQKWEHTQETNLQFVAFTRSKTDLIYIALND